MPHVVVKLVPGKSEEQKTRLAEEIAQDVMKVLNYPEEAVSVANRRGRAAGLGRESLQPEIQGKWNTVYKKPGYNPFEK